MAASFSLIIEDDAGKQIVVPFAKDVITIGRKEGNTIRLTERNVSRFHAKLMKDNGGVFVEDLSSFNGIKLNGDRISGTVQVNSGDVIEIGDYHLELRSAQAANVGPVGSKSVNVGVVDDLGPGTSDEFEGDTQRWDAPAPQPTATRMPLRAPEALPSHGGFGGDGGDTERLDMSRLQALASGGQMAAPPPDLPPPQSWPAPPRPQQASPPLSMADLEPTARQPISGVPLGGVAAAAAPFNATQQEVTQDFAPARPTPLRDLIADPGDALPAPAPRSEPPALTPVMAATPSSTPPPSAVAARPPPRRNFEETEQLRVAPGASATDEALRFPRLIALNTIFAGLEFPLKGMENVLGRTDDNDIVIEHRSISRNHAKFVRQGDRVQVLDLKSANGVLVNDAEVEQHTLRSGDVVELGRVKLRFVPVGERFALPSDEVERARLADQGGDDFEDGAKTTMVTHDGVAVAGRGELQPKASRPIALYAVLAALAVVVVVLAALLLTRGGPAEAPPSGTIPSTTTSLGPSIPATASPSVAPAPASSTPPPAAPAPAAVATRTPDAATAADASGAGGDGLATDPTLTSPGTAPEATATPDATPKATKTTPPSSRKPTPLDPRVAADRVLDLYAKGKLIEAIAILKELEKQTPEDAKYKSQIALYYAKMRDSKNATAYFVRFKQASSDQSKVQSLQRALASHGIKVEP